jgi:FkbM family methyltransferase
VYSVGVGTDVSFDLELIGRFGSRVHAFDPTPRSIEWIRKQVLPSEFEFHDYGVADFNGTMTFNPPGDPSFVSYSAVRHHSSGISVEAPVRRLTSIVKSLGHDHIDVLKMDIEGAEYGVISNLLSSGIRVEQLLVEFHHQWPEIGIEKTKNAIAELNAAGLRIFYVSPSGEEYSFIRS